MLHSFEGSRRCTTPVNTERLARLLGTNMKHAHRTRALLHLQRSPRVRTDFSFRPTGALVDKTYYREPDNSTFNTRYYMNIRDNLYTLCSFRCLSRSSSPAPATSPGFSHFSYAAGHPAGLEKCRLRHSHIMF